MSKDLLRRWRSPLAPLVFLFFPFLFSGLIALAFGSGENGSMPRFKLAVVDEDGGFLAGLVRGALGQEQAAKFLEVSKATLPEALSAIERNRVAGALVIPKGFTDAVWKNEPAQLRVIRNPAQAIGPVAVEETAEFLALLLNGAGDLLAEPIRRIREQVEASPQASGGMGAWAKDMAVADISVLTSHTFDAAGRFLLPPKIRIEKADAPGVPRVAAGAADSSAAGGSASTKADDSTFRSIFKGVLPGMAAFALFVLAIGLMGDVFVERRRGTLARQLAAPIGTRELVVGKISATLAVGLVVALFMALIGGLLLGARADPGAFALLSLAFLLAVTGFVTLIYSFARNEQRGGTLASIILMVMAFLGGSFLPLEMLPRVVRSLAPFTLNYWAVEGFQTLLFTQGGVGAIGRPLIVLAAVGVVSTLAGAAILQRQLVRGD